MNVLTDIATAVDPARLFERAGIGTPDSWQEGVLRGAWDRLQMLCSRQAGKSTTVAALAAHEAIYTAESLTLITAPSQRQAKETLAKFWDFYQALPSAAGVDAKSELRVRFENGSRVIALPGTEKTIRGYSGVDLLVLDEAARVEDELYEAVRPMLAVSGGRLAALTTPAGKRGWFFEAWSDPKQDWKRVKITAHDCPRISEAFLKQERRELGTWMFRQEYLTEFVDPVNQMFRTEEIEGAFSSEVKPLFEAEETETASAGTDPVDPSIDVLDV
jgi:hypothetical protein